jgi:hypothetical protein
VRPRDQALVVRGLVGCLDEGSIVTVAVIVSRWSDYQGHHTGTGYILAPHKVTDAHGNICDMMYPYVWDADRFVPAPK